jgi:hypothetical protein
VATTSAIPVAKVFPQAVGVGRDQIGTNSVSEVTLPVHAIQTPQPTQQQSQQTIVAAQQAISQAANVYIQTSHRTSPGNVQYRYLQSVGRDCFFRILFSYVDVHISLLKHQAPLRHL